jgi:hypothetical protein
VDEGLPPEAAAANHDDEAGSLVPDPNLVMLADRAVVAGLTAVWIRFKDRTGKLVGPLSLRIKIPSGRRVRDMHLSADDAKALAQFKFEQWIALGEYEAILDTANRTILAEVHLRARSTLSLRRMPGIVTDRTISMIGRERNTYRLVVQAPTGDLSLELYQHCPPEIATLKGQRGLFGAGLTIRGVTATHHNEALKLLQDVANSFFVDLDIDHGITANLVQAYDTELFAQDEYEHDPPNTAAPSFPSASHDPDAAALYLYARSVSQMPLLEYLAYYQVIEFYLPRYTSRSAITTRVRNMLADQAFDYNNDRALGRLLDAIAPIAKRGISEREQVATTITCCVDYAAISTFLADRPALAKALADKDRIRGVRVIDVTDREVQLVRQIASRVYDLRCRIVHSKDGGGESDRPIRPFDRESRLMRHDLSLIRFIAQRVLIASSRPPSWR